MKEKKRAFLKTLAVILWIILALSVGWIVFDQTVDRSGWVEKDGQYSYRDFHGRKISGWLELDEKTYYLNRDCIMVTGWHNLSGSRYYFAGDGVMATGWRNVDDMRCYFGDDGALRTGWLELDDKRYYMSEEGAMLSGWQDVDGSTYYFGENGAMISGWNQLDGETYYFEETGALVTGKVLLEDKHYYFREDGTMFTGWEETDDGRSYYGDDGVQAFGWTEIEEKRYFFGDDGITHTGWHEEGEYRYYLLKDGSAATGPTVIDGETYYFTPKGIHVVLVNADHPVPDYYKAKMVTYIQWHQVAEIALEPLKKMLEDCRAAGYDYVFNSAYRSIQTQQDILTLRTQEHIDIGYPKEEAYREARKTVALPGTSEHHLGLAVDVLNNAQASKKALDWLSEHCWEYGFILRYLEEKASITGIIYEPWHFRYVGTEVSMDMKDSGLCLEEYLGAGAVTNSTIE